jgi:hypothetical protein
MGLVQPEVRGDAYNAHFLRCKAAITLEQSGTKQTTNIAVKIRNFGRPGSGQLGRDVICEGCSVCAILYRVAIDALQMRIISRCNETYHLTTRQCRRYTASMISSPGDGRCLISGTTFCHYHKLGKFPLIGGSATTSKEAMATCIGSSPAAPLPEMEEQPTFRGRMLNPPEMGKLIRTSHALEGS